MFVDSISRKTRQVARVKKRNGLPFAILVTAVIITLTLSLPDKIFASVFLANTQKVDPSSPTLTKEAISVSTQSLLNLGLSSPTDIDGIPYWMSLNLLGYSENSWENTVFRSTAFVNVRAPQDQGKFTSNGLKIAFAIPIDEAKKHYKKFCQARIVAGVVFVERTYQRDTDSYKNTFAQLASPNLASLPNGDYFRLKFSCDGGTGEEKTRRGWYRWQTTVAERLGYIFYITEYSGSLFNKIAGLAKGITASSSEIQRSGAYIMAMSVGNHCRHRQTTFEPYSIVMPTMKNMIDNLGTGYWGQTCSIDSKGRFHCPYGGTKCMGDNQLPCMRLGSNGAITIADPDT